MLAQVVVDSKLDEVKRVGDTTRNISVLVYDWQLHVRKLVFRNIPNIAMFHKFVFSKEFKGRLDYLN